jgi:hypothetical protein
MNGADGKSRCVANVIHDVDDKELAPPANGGPCCGSSGCDGDYDDHCTTFGGGGGGNDSNNAAPLSESLSLIAPPSMPPLHNAVGHRPPPHVASCRHRNRNCNHRDNDNVSPALALPHLVGRTVLILMLVGLLLFNADVVIPPLPRCAMSLLLLPLRAFGDDCRRVLYKSIN